MWPIGNMLWRIGERIDIDEQVAWVREADFRGVGVHAHAGTPGQWAGLDPQHIDARDRMRWRDQLADFAWREVHAPFAAEITVERQAPVMAALNEVLAFAGDIGASVVTVHACWTDGGSQADMDSQHAAARELHRAALAAGVHIGLEVLDGFDMIDAWALSHIGVTLDVGHWFTRYPGGNIGDAIRRIGPRLVHLHMHDVADGVDHVEIGTGRVDFPAILGALRDIRYTGGLCLEMNPDRVTPEGIRRSQERLEMLMRSPEQ